MVAGLYLGIKESPKDLELPKCNYRNFYDEIPVAKDTEWQRKHPNLTAADALKTKGILILLWWRDSFKSRGMG